MSLEMVFPCDSQWKMSVCCVWCVVCVGQIRAGQGRAGQGRARQGRAGQGRAGQGRSGQIRSDQIRSDQGRAGQGRAGQGRREEERRGEERRGEERRGEERRGEERQDKAKGEKGKRGVTDWAKDNEQRHIRIRSPHNVNLAQRTRTERSWPQQKESGKLWEVCQSKSRGQYLLYDNRYKKILRLHMSARCGVCLHLRRLRGSRPLQVCWIETEVWPNVSGFRAQILSNVAHGCRWWAQTETQTESQRDMGEIRCVIPYTPVGLIISSRDERSLSCTFKSVHVYSTLPQISSFDSEEQEM